MTIRWLIRSGKRQIGLLKWQYAGRLNASRDPFEGRIWPESVTRFCTEPKAEHEALQAMRIEQQTEEWKERYNKRAGIEGALAKGIQVMGLRCTRYVGLAKTHLQHVLTTVAMNVARIVAWLKDEPLPKLRVSRFGALAPA